MVPLNGEPDQLRRQVRAAAGGDPDAWEALYRRVYPKLFAYARRRLSNDVAADDAVSEAMSRAISEIHAFRWQGGGFDAWMYGITRNVVLETYRNERRSSPVDEIPEPATTVLGGGTSGRDPAEVVDERASRDALRQAFARLSATDQEVLELRVVGELSSDEVAVVTGRRSGAVRTAQSRAIQRLRRLMEEVIHG